MKEVVSVREDIVRADPSKSNGMGHQDWLTEPNPDGPVHYYRRDKGGRWREYLENPITGRMNSMGEGFGLILGFRWEYYDYSA